MTDPLAHLYGDALEDELEDAVPVPTVRTSLEELLEVEPEPDVVDDHDVDVLAGMVELNPSDANAVELGLGAYVDGELVFNDLGRRVFRRIVERLADR